MLPLFRDSDRASAAQVFSKPGKKEDNRGELEAWPRIPALGVTVPKTSSPPPGDVISPPQEEPASSSGRVTPGFEPNTTGVSTLPETGAEEPQGV